MFKLSGKNIKNTKKGYIVLAAGGTGGHVFPAQAIAETFSANNRVLLVTDLRGQRFASGIFANKENIKVIDIRGISGTLNEKVSALSKMFWSFIRLFFTFFKDKPSIVIGFGGYPSVPVVASAFFLQVPIIIHEQNAVMGKANKFLAKVADVVAVSSKNTINIGGIASYKLMHVGNPIRSSIMTLLDKPYKRADKNIFRILVIGGSQGASIFGDVMPKAIKLLDESIQKKLIIFQQSRADELQKIAADYKGCHCKIEIKSFFQDIDSMLYKCDLVISRSGAATVHELIAARKPSILVPFAASQNNHQYYNAKILADQNAAILLTEEDCTPERVAFEITDLLSDSDRFAVLQASMKKVKFSDGTKRLSEVVEKFLIKK